MGLLDAIQSPDARMAIGLLAAAGPTREPSSFGQRMLGLLGQLDQQRIAEEERRQRAALQQLQMQRDMLQMQQIQAQMAEHQRMVKEQEQAKALREQYLSRLDPNQGPPIQATVPGALSAGLSVQEAAAIMPQPPKPAEFKEVGGSLLRIQPDGSVKEVFHAQDKPAAPTELSKLLAEMQALPPGSPLRAIYQQQINKLTTHAPPQTTISMGAPVPAILSDGTRALVQPANRPGEPSQIMRDPATGSPLKPARDDLKPVPPNINTAISENRAALAKVDKALQAIERNPGALGAKNYLGEFLMQRLDPAGVDVRALVSDIGSLKIHDRSGAAVTASEFPRLRPFIPRPEDEKDVAAKKLRLFKAEYEALLNDFRQTYNEQNGYHTPPVLKLGGDLPPADAIEAELRRRAGGR
jgi:hypothetical protein